MEKKYLEKCVLEDDDDEWWLIDAHLAANIRAVQLFLLEPLN